MLLDEVNFTKKDSKKRVGRGISAGGGKTAGRGTKGQKARSGYSRRHGFEGGQTPLFRRLPKLKGFKRSYVESAQAVNIANLTRLDGKVVSAQTLADSHLIKDPKNPVKLIGNSKLETAYDVQVAKLSAGAKSAIEAAGGSVSNN